MAFPSFTKTSHSEPYPSILPTNPSLSAKGKIALITGGGRGIGKAIAIAFASAGASSIIITGRSKSSLDGAADEIKACSSNQELRVGTFEADITDIKAMETVFETVKKDYGLIDIVVSNAGYLNTPSSIISSPLEDYWQTFEVNVKGSIIVAQSFLNSKAGHPTSTFINISSGAAHIPYIPDYSAYAASKLATVKVMEYLQHEQPELRVFQIQPGSVETDMQKKAGREARDSIDLPAAFCVWLATNSEADFLKGRFLWANWDVDELVGRKEEILEKDLLNVRLLGWGN